jgi:peptide/nickel transport system substrate-binding protein
MEEKQMTQRGSEPVSAGSEDGLSRRGFLTRGAGTVGAIALGGAFGGGLAAPLDALAAQQRGKRGGTIKLAISDINPDDSFDPQKNSSTMGLLSAGLMYDSLVQMDQFWNITPMLASDWSVSKDAKTYTFKLRKGVEFHNGKPLQSADVKYTIVRMLKGGATLHGAQIFGPVLKESGISTPDPQTVRFHLYSPDGFFLVKLGFWYGKIIQRGADFSKADAGTGPFKGVSYKGGQGFQVVRNDNYFMHGLPYLDGITGVAVTDVASKVESVITGDIDFSDPGDFSTIKNLQAAKNASYLLDEFGFPYVMGINSTVKPYSDPNVRQAMKLLINRKEYVELVAEGWGTPTPDYFINPKDPFFPPGLKPPAYDPEQAKSLLKKAGYSSGFKDTAWTAPFPGMPQMATVFKASMAQGGIDISVENVPIPQWETKLFKANIVANYWGRQHISTMAPYMAQTGGQWNEDRLSDPTINKWITEARSTTNPKRQKEIYWELGRRYAHETACIWPFASKNLWPHKKRLQGTVLSPTSLVDFRNATLA